MKRGGQPCLPVQFSQSIQFRMFGHLGDRDRPFPGLHWEGGGQVGRDVNIRKTRELCSGKHGSHRWGWVIFMHHSAMRIGWGCVNSPPRPRARGSQEARFTLHSLHLFLHVCTVNYLISPILNDCSNAPLRCYRFFVSQYIFCFSQPRTIRSSLSASLLLTYSSRGEDPPPYLQR